MVESILHISKIITNFNILRQIAMNILKLDTSFKESIPNKQFRCLLDSAYLDHLIDLWICS